MYKVNQCKLSDKYFTAVFKDCKELKINGYINDGVYFIYPYLPIATSVRVYCDMTTDGGGWTVGFSLLILNHLSPTNIFILLIKAIIELILDFDYDQKIGSNTVLLINIFLQVLQCSYRRANTSIMCILLKQKKTRYILLSNAVACNM